MVAVGSRLVGCAGLCCGRDSRAPRRVRGWPMTDWNPATEAEAALGGALAGSDQEQYFRVLSRTELLLPVSVEALAGRAPMGWGTWTTGNRTHVLAFTSPVALQACLNEPGGTFRTVPFHTLAAE